MKPLTSFPTRRALLAASCAMLAGVMTASAQSSSSSTGSNSSNASGSGSYQSSGSGSSRNSGTSGTYDRNSGSGSSANNANTSSGSQTGSTMSGSSTYGTTGTSSNTASMGGNTKLSWSDKRFVTKAAEDGQAEVQLAQLAAQRAQNPEVRSFAQRLVTDHTQVNSELMSIASSKQVNLDKEDNKDRAYRRLSKENGADFDREFVEHMIDQHEKDIKAFDKAAQDAKDQEIRSFASKHVGHLREHLQQAQTLRQSVMPTGRTDDTTSSSTGLGGTGSMSDQSGSGTSGSSTGSSTGASGSTGTSGTSGSGTSSGASGTSGSTSGSSSDNRGSR